MSVGARSHRTAATKLASDSLPLVGSIALLQGLAVVTMTIDHLGAVAILGDWSRFVGRFALPAFVVMVAYNALRTSRPGQMAWRCLLLFLVSQPLWCLSVGTWDRLNIMVTLIAVVLLVWSWRLRWPLLALVVGFVFALVSPWVEYGPLPLLLLPLVLTRSPLALVCALVWGYLQYLYSYSLMVAALVSVALVVILLRVRFDVPRLPRWLTQWFYPLHLAAIKIAI